MIKLGAIVRVTSEPSRKARMAHRRQGVAITDSFMKEGVEVCPVGFYSQQYGAWTQIVPVATIVVLDAPEAEDTRPLPLSSQPEYRIWMSMRRRCSDPRSQGFHTYGGRVKVCASWQSFAQFLQDVGPRPSPKHSLDRIDNQGDYEPNNVRWATPLQQARNTSRTRFLTAFGQTKPLTQWAEEIGITPQSLKQRVDKGGWDVETAVSRPMMKSQPYIDALKSNRVRGEMHHLARLTEMQVGELRADRQKGCTFKDLAQKYGVSVNTAMNIVKKATWKH